MGTRGCYGFRINASDKVTYNHFDSYPEGLGVTVVEFIRNTSDDEMKEIAKKIELVSECNLPTPEQITICKEAGLVNLDVNSGKEEDWYCLMREAQGDLSVYKKIPYMTDSKDFLADSLYCEWAYIINLDESVLEVYRGFNRNPVSTGRYAPLIGSKVSNQYYGVVLVCQIPLEQIRTISNDEFVKLTEVDTGVSKE